MWHNSAPVSYTHPQYFGFKQHGAVAPGYAADLIVVSDFESFTVEQVYKNGTLVAEHGKTLKPAPVSYTHLDVYKRQASSQRKTLRGNDFFFWFFIELLYFISIFHSHCSRCRSTCCRKSRSLRGNGAHRDLPAGWGNPSRPRGQNEWACPENSCRIYRPFGFAAACLAGGSACRP